MDGDRMRLNLIDEDLFEHSSLDSFSEDTWNQLFLEVNEYGSLKVYLNGLEQFPMITLY